MTYGHVTETDIVTAAKLIAAQGEIPTIAGVRQKLNGRGSETTILNYLRKWKIKLLALAVYFDENDLNVERLLELKQHMDAQQQIIERQNASIEGLRDTAAHYQTENIVLTHGIQRLNNQIQELSLKNVVLEEKLKCSQAINSALNTVEELVQQKVQNQTLVAKLQSIKQEIACLRESLFKSC